MIYENKPHEPLICTLGDWGSDWIKGPEEALSLAFRDACQEIKGRKMFTNQYPVGTCQPKA